METESEYKEKLFNVARSLIPAARAFGQNQGLRPGLAEDMMMESVKRILEYHQTHPDQTPHQIKNLPAYIFTTARNLIADELQKQSTETEFDDEAFSDEEPFARLERRILASEIVRRMNPKSRAIYGYLIRGHSYEEIAREFERKLGKKVTAATLRSDFSKTVRRISKELRALPR